MNPERILRASISLFAFLAVTAILGPAAHATGTAPANPASGENVKPAPKPKPRGPVVLKVADQSVNFGAKFRLRGQTGNRSHGRVRIQSRVNGGWHTLRKVTTDAKGRYQSRVRARNSTHLRAVSKDGRRSRARKVVVIGHVKLNRSPRYVRLGRKLVVSGSVVPRGVRTVRIRVRRQGVITVRSRANGRFRAAWKPRSAGDFSYRVRMLPSAKSTGDASLRHRFSALRPGHASYYGPGLYGNGVACGGTLTPGTRGVAHKHLPCGTRVTLQYGKRTVVARVIDRGPYIAGRDWDLTERTKKDLGFGGVGVVWTNR